MVPCRSELAPQQAGTTLRYRTGDTYQVPESAPYNNAALQLVPGYVEAPGVQGETLGNERHGRGVHISASGDRYEGAWKRDARHGQGTATFACGKSYAGDWLNDKAHG